MSVAEQNVPSKQPLPQVRTITPWLVVCVPLFALLLLLPAAWFAIRLGTTVDYYEYGGARGNWIIGEVNNQRHYSQSFVLAGDRLTGVELLLFRARQRTADDNKFVLVRLRTTNRPGPDLAIVAMPLRDLNPYGPTAFRFPPFTPTFPVDQVDTTLFIEVDAPALEPGSGLMIAGSTENYFDGVLRVNDTRFTRFDLAFTPFYEPLVGDRYLPISRMAHGRPGLLGWPPFYLLLILAYSWTALVAVCFFGWRMLQPQPRRTDDI